MGKVDFNVWVDRDSVRKLNLEQFVPMQIWLGKDFVGFIEKEDRKLLISFTGRDVSSVLEDGTSVLTLLIYEVLYAEVEEYKRFIIYDPAKRILEYTDNLDSEHCPLYENTRVLKVIPLYSKTSDIALGAIREKEEFEKK